MKVIVTRFALTSGVVVEDVEPCEETPTMVQVRRVQYYYLHKPDWHTSKQEAKAQVAKMFVRRVASLEKSLSGLDDKHSKANKAIEEAQL